ncbi:TlpA family protein disulfide reductase [Methylophilus sp. 13]|uniref:TlpA family protein disulfide reductase n=1 Tax=Methylophilus sp. 13 TaxID=2781018 RepID=UPI00189088A0|nr:TlpA disulfide reductase family protein [Methylophilus sp. 13]MBF5037894.1 TlpA family protein disulfide reductase [Methylophilus sp. 13]
MKNITRVAVVIAAMAFIAGVIYTEGLGLFPTANKAESNNPVYALSYPDKDKNAYDFSQLRGKVAVVNFWATWCGPCRDEMPDLNQLSQSYKDSDVVFIGIAADDAEQVGEFLESTKVDYKIVTAEFDAIPLSQSLGNNNSVLPFTLIIDQTGKILDRHVGRIKSDEIRSIVDAALTSKQN